MKPKPKTLKVTSPGVCVLRDKNNTSGEYKLSREEIIQDEPVKPSSTRRTMGMTIPPASGQFLKW